MRTSRLVRKLHKWFGLAVGLQLLIWSISGFYMVAVHIDIIHGDMLIDTDQPGELWNKQQADWSELIPFSQIRQEHPNTTRITLTKLLDKPVYQLETKQKTVLLDAISGQSISPLGMETARNVARHHYAGDDQIDSVKLLIDNPPSEIGSRPLPIWRIDFDDIWGSTFYVSPDTGELLTRRHTLWRVFDFLWMLHIMDYDKREDVNNSILRVVSTLGLVLGISGAWLVYFSFRRRGWNFKRRRGANQP